MHALDERSTSIMQVRLVEMSSIWGAAVTPWCLMGCLDEYTQVKHYPIPLHDPSSPTGSNPTSSLLTDFVSIIQNCLSVVHFPVLGNKIRKGYLEYCDVTPPLSTLPSLPSFSFATFYPHGLPMYPGCVPELFVLLHPPCLLPLLSSPHPLSLCLVCLLSQLLPKKRSLFRIHAGRKQRYPWQQACARGTLKSITPLLLLL